MRNLFIDTNVLIDFLADRMPFAEEATKLFNYCLLGRARVYISTVSYNNIYYILRQSLSHSETMKLLGELAEMTEMIDVNKAVIRKSLKSDFKDFEDAIQYNCALQVGKIDCIVTRDTRDFKRSEIPVMTPHEAVSMF